jgi:hypothetical protein
MQPETQDPTLFTDRPTSPNVTPVLVVLCHIQALVDLDAVFGITCTFYRDFLSYWLVDVTSIPAARAVLDRLAAFLDRFAGCFGRRTQRQSASRYVDGVLNDSERKSMQPMEARLPLNDAAS